jgi:hypothetical protein
VLLSAGLVIAAATGAMARGLAKLAFQDFAKRAAEAGGGFSLSIGPNNDCPEGSSSCAVNCCPNSLTCESGIAGTIVSLCCPAGKEPVRIAAVPTVMLSKDADADVSFRQIVRA